MLQLQLILVFQTGFFGDIDVGNLYPPKDGYVGDSLISRLSVSKKLIRYLILQCVLLTSHFPFLFLHHDAFTRRLTESS